MKNPEQIVIVANMVVMVALIIIVAMQNKSSGLSNVFGGSGNVVQTRRGVDKWLFYATIVAGVLFVGLSVASLVLSK
jgi:protein translocase SecG subunit